VIVVKYDPDADGAYIQLLDSSVPLRVAHSYPCDVLEVNGMINLDFDSDWRLVGIEVMEAYSKLPAEFLREVSDASARDRTGRGGAVYEPEA
jgi:uncharacterized protein YuzE